MKRRAHHSAVHFRKTATASLALCAVLALTACSSSDGKDEASDESPTVTQSPTASASADPEETAVLAAYTQSWEAQTKAYAEASSAGTDLRKTTTLRALGLIEQDLETMRKAGQVTIGKPMIRPQDPKVTDGEIPKATLTDCVDTTNWTLIDKATKKKVPLPSTRLVKYVSTAKFEKWGTKWMVTELTAQPQTC